MKKLSLIFCIALFAPPLFAVTTHFINDLQFDRINSFSFSNIAFREDGGIELSPPSTELYRNSETLWSFAQYKQKNYIGIGSTAAILELDGLNGKSGKLVYQNTNASFVSEIIRNQNHWIIAEVPTSSIKVLNNRFQIIKTYSVTNHYTWGLVPLEGGIAVIGGYPAAISLIAKNKVSLLTVLPNEEHLFKGVVDHNILYFNGETTMYSYRKGKVHALASFDKPISDFVFHNGVIYVITSSGLPSTKKISSDKNQPLSSQGSKNQVQSSSFVQNGLYRVVPGQSQALLAEQKGLSFLSLNMLDNRLIIGTDKDGGYFTFSISDKQLRYSSLGEGVFMRMFQTGKTVFGILLNPSRLVRFDNGYAGSGWMQSDIQDTGNISDWGTPRMKTETPAGTFVHLHTRSGAVENTAYWDDWMETDGKIRSLPNRFLQYRINLASNGKLTPRVYALSIPFVQHNLLPQLSIPTLHYEKQGVKVSWTVKDPNHDVTENQIFLLNDQGQEIALTDEPIRDNFFEITSDRFPPGKYRLHIICSDAPSNPQNTALSTEIKSPVFYVDNDAPVVSDLSVQSDKFGHFQVSFSASDALIPVNKAFYSINGRPAVSLPPKDEIFDQTNENFGFELTVSTPALLTLGVSDRLGNTVYKGVWLK